MPTQSKWQSLPTEAINPVSLAIDKTPVRDIIDMVVNEDRKVIAAVQKEKERIAHGVEIIAQALRKGGRIIFVGAGTSGRLGVVEASEMPPTFGTSPRVVQAIMAGGQEAVFKAKEGVEDNYEEGARSIARLRLTQRDVVVGVSASGMTPFVRGGLTRARKAGAKIIFVTCWPGSELQTFVDLQIAPAVGPELIAGSTRLKAGTATKMVLNMLTTVAMIKVGKTYGNLMVDVQTGSEKLKDRARRIVSMVTGHRLRRRRRAAQAREVQRQGGDRDAEDRADAADGAAAPEEGRRLGARGDRRRHRDLEPAQTSLAGRVGAARRGPQSVLAPRLGTPPGCRPPRYRPRRRRPGAAAGTTPAAPVVIGPFSSRSTHDAFDSPGREQDDRPRLKDRRHPHRQRFARARRSESPPNSAALLRRVSGLQLDAMGARLQRRRRLVETDVAVGADAEDLHVDAAGARDRLLVALALRLGIRRVAVEEVDLRRRRGGRGRTGASSMKRR